MEYTPFSIGYDDLYYITMTYINLIKIQVYLGKLPYQTRSDRQTNKNYNQFQLCSAQYIF